MPHTNPYFSTTTGYSGEQQLLDDLTIEQIAIYGLDIYFMPRKLMNMDKLFNESSKSAFETAMPIPMYIKTFDGYDNGMELLTKFGVRSAEQITLQMSRTQFQTYYTPFLKEYYKQGDGFIDNDAGETELRPKEGDLIYFPFDDGIFEIKYVQFDQPFFQFGKGYVFEIQCEKFEYSGESFSTGIEDIDDTPLDTEFYKTEFTLDAGGVDTFTIREQVTIYNVSNVETPTTDVPGTIDPFSVYDEEGLLEDVPTVTATVQAWNQPGRVLVVMDISDLDPDQKNTTTNDITENKFDRVLIVGNTSGARWLSSKAEMRDEYTTDNNIIQDDFDKIKVVDPADVNPFGFV